jgi:Phage integrase, N-terminal SAM-like domain
MELVLDSDAVTGKPKKKLLDRVRDVMRLKHYSLRTERTYCDWITRFIRFHWMRHPAEMSEPEMAEFLTHLARAENISHRPKIRPLARSSSLYKEVLKQNEIRRSDVQL